MLEYSQEILKEEKGKTTKKKTMTVTRRRPDPKRKSLEIIRKGKTTVRSGRKRKNQEEIQERR